jgi:hypothetical protein
VSGEELLRSIEVIRETYDLLKYKKEKEQREIKAEIRKEIDKQIKKK